MIEVGTRALPLAGSESHVLFDAHARPVCDVPGQMAQGLGDGMGLGLIVPNFTGPPPGTGWRWTHLRRCAAAEEALLADPDIPDDVAWALLEIDTLPRMRIIDGVALLILRGVNLRPGAEPEDMISIRLCILPNRIVSIEIRRLDLIDRLIHQFHRGTPPTSPGAFVVTLVEGLRAEAEPVLDELEDSIARLETRALTADGGLKPADRARLIDARKEIIVLHRFISPQSLALETLSRAAPDWLPDPESIHEEAEGFRRIAADLDTLRGRAQLIAEEISLAVAERTNQIILTLSLVTVVFLPLHLVAGMFGVNLAGIPFNENPWAFAALWALLVVIGGITLVIARRMMR